MTCIGVAVPTWEIAARHIQADTVSCFEDIAGCPEINFVLVGFSWFNERRGFTLGKVAIACANDTVGKILCVAIGMDIDQTSHEIGIQSARRGPEVYHDRAGYLNILL